MATVLILLTSALRRSRQLSFSSRGVKLATHFPSGDATPAGRRAYIKGWVGFSALHDRVNCSEAITSPKRNFRYPQTVPRVSSREILQQCRNSCTEFAEVNGFMRYPKATKEEQQFPIAFIILFHKDLDQVSGLISPFCFYTNTQNMLKSYKYSKDKL